ncbi:2',3'-cyclic-nucleotide 3'-phosphodiesterase, partial [Sphaerosporella brunnea]
ASLWLVPPADSALESALQKLISDTLPAHFAATEQVPSFAPHLTLTSNLPKEFSNPQEVLSQITVSSLPEVIFKSVNVGDFFFTRLTLHTEKTASLVALAQQCRRKFSEGCTSDREAEAWAQNVFTPHVSLVYSAMPAEDVKADVLEKAVKDIDAAGVVVGGGVASEMGGWKGGKIVLVQTWKDLSEWKVLAEKAL